MTFGLLPGMRMRAAGEGRGGGVKRGAEELSCGGGQMMRAEEEGRGGRYKRRKIQEEEGSGGGQRRKIQELGLPSVLKVSSIS